MRLLLGVAEDLGRHVYALRDRFLPRRRDHLPTGDGEPPPLSNPKRDAPGGLEPPTHGLARPLPSARILGSRPRVAPGAAPDLDGLRGRVILICLMRSTGNAAELPVHRRPSAGPRASSSPLERVGGTRRAHGNRGDQPLGELVPDVGVNRRGIAPSQAANS